MLFHNDIIANAKTWSGGPFHRLVVKKGLNIFSLTSAGMPARFQRIRISTLLPQILRRCGQRRLENHHQSSALRLAGGVKPSLI